MVGEAQPLEAFVFGVFLYVKKFLSAEYRIKDKIIISM